MLQFHLVPDGVHCEGMFTVLRVCFLYGHIGVSLGAKPDEVFDLHKEIWTNQPVVKLKINTKTLSN